MIQFENEKNLSIKFLPSTLVRISLLQIKTQFQGKIKLLKTNYENFNVEEY